MVIVESQTEVTEFLNLWNTNFPTIESQSDECLDLIIDLLP
jgi:hypothetical protein